MLLFTEIIRYVGMFMIAGILFYYMYRTNKHADIEMKNLRNMDK